MGVFGDVSFSSAHFPSGGPGFRNSPFPSCSTDRGEIPCPPVSVPVSFQIFLPFSFFCFFGGLPPFHVLVGWQVTAKNPPTCPPNTHALSLPLQPLCPYLLLAVHKLSLGEAVSLITFRSPLRLWSPFLEPFCVLPLLFLFVVCRILNFTRLFYRPSPKNDLSLQFECSDPHFLEFEVETRTPTSFLLSFLFFLWHKNSPRSPCEIETSLKPQSLHPRTPWSLFLFPGYWKPLPFGPPGNVGSFLARPLSGPLISPLPFRRMGVPAFIPKPKSTGPFPPLQLGSTRSLSPLSPPQHPLPLSRRGGPCG